MTDSPATPRRRGGPRESCASPGGPRESGASPGRPRESAARPGGPRESAARPGRPRPSRALPGRPREARADRAILAAALELMAEHGVRDLRMDDLAARAAVGKATIYRRYRSKDELVAGAVAALVSEIAVPDTGSTRGDLLALMNSAVAVYRGSVEAAVMPSLIDAMSRDADLARAVRERVVEPRRAALCKVLERGIARGDLPADLDLELALDTLGGPLFYRLLVTGGPIDKRLAEGVVDLIMKGPA